MTHAVLLNSASRTKPDYCPIIPSLAYGAVNFAIVTSISEQYKTINVLSPDTSKPEWAYSTLTVFLTNHRIKVQQKVLPWLPAESAKALTTQISLKGPHGGRGT